MNPARCAHACALVGCVAAVALWASTGAEGFTRWPDAKLAAADAPPQPDESQLLADAGFSGNQKAPATPDIRSRFALGLLPGGLAPSHLLSVASILALSAAVSSVAFLAQRRAQAQAARAR